MSKKINYKIGALKRKVGVKANDKLAPGSLYNKAMKSIIKK